MIALLAVALALMAPLPAVAKKLALVIGNDAYESLPVLRKATNDAEAVAATLESIGYTVTEGTNLTRRDMSRLVSEVETQILPGDEVFFFFAGHGVAIGGENLLIPADMPKLRSGDEGMARDEGFAVSDLIARFQRKGAAAVFLVLDACRDNPFAQEGVRSVGGSRGLAQVEAPSGVFVLFSAGIGQSALDRLSEDDPNPNSVFTRNLVPLLTTPGLSHVALSKRIQRDVSQLAASVAHLQQPAYYDQIIGEVVFREGPPAAQTEVASAPAMPSGHYESSLKSVSIACTTGMACVGEYAGEGDRKPAIIAGDFAADGTLSGRWVEARSNQPCDEEWRGSLYWGRFQFHFDETRDAWTGRWSYCGNEPDFSVDRRVWDGWRS